MDWNKLLSHKRLGKENKIDKFASTRTEFQKDFDRIVFSSEFRRLQNKTQVMPLPGSDYVRNRLTHSLETSSVARTLGTIVGTEIIKNNKEIEKEHNITASEIGSVVSAAALAHDIGNPPFGHAGEDAISEYFKKNTQFLKNLNEFESADLQNFEGNAAGFRLIANSLAAQTSIAGGLGLTYTTYATFTKYPKFSLPDLKKTGIASEKKFSIFQSEKEIFKKIALETGLKAKGDTERWHRHPLTFLVEAADDICYHIIDFEDGYHVGNIDFNTIESLFKEILKNNWGKEIKRYNQIFDKSKKINYLRAKVISELVKEVTQIFIENENKLLKGDFDTALLDCVKQFEILKEIKDISVKKLYKSRVVVEIESAGFTVIPGLLDAFLNAVFDPQNKKNKLLKELIPKQYLSTDKTNYEDYQKILNIVMFVSGMTDKYAINLYKKINGISLPEY
ncbi:MAG: deoxyguanosinetriphosphate triphosphohydrolase [Bacteroidota bacterium]|nr:deoxyguanosinetriphosphate triphosphohydrolase [Bacteroidota bacterium]